MTKSTRARYTLEFKQEAVGLVESGQSIAAAARSLGVVEQTLFNWVKAKKGAHSSKAVSAVWAWLSRRCSTGSRRSGKAGSEQMEISRLRAELGRVKMERDILGKATAYFAKGQK